MCVNALNGLFLFLRRKENQMRLNDIMCQRPKRAFLISTSYTCPVGRRNEICVNALNGLFLFLQLFKGGLRDVTEKCVNALNGLFLFLQDYEDYEEESEPKGVNALNGLFLFLLTQKSD